MLLELVWLGCLSGSWFFEVILDVILEARLTIVGIVRQHGIGHLLILFSDLCVFRRRVSCFTLCSSSKEEFV